MRWSFLRQIHSATLYYLTKFADPLILNMIRVIKSEENYSHKLTGLRPWICTKYINSHLLRMLVSLSRRIGSSLV